MRKYLFLLVPGLLAACGQTVDPVPDPDPDPTPVEPEVVTPTFAKGADISWASEMEHDGKTFKKADGTTADLLDVLKECGINAIRLRVWVDPYAGWSGQADMLALAKRVHAAGLSLMVDFHYSDFFADPTRQVVPSAWQADKDDLDKMCSHVAAHTTEVLQALKDANIAPAWIQIGNETRNGMLWPAGQLWTSSGDIPDGRKHFARLYNAGYDAAKALFPDALVMPHLNNAYEDNAWWFKQVKEAGGKFDAIALSHYPQAESGMTSAQYNAEAIKQIKALCSSYKLPVFISEVGVLSSRTDAASVLQSFMTEVKKIDLVKGVFYWEPEVYGSWKPAVYSKPEELTRLTGTKQNAWAAYNQGAFNNDGSASAIMNVFND